MRMNVKKIVVLITLIVFCSGCRGLVNEQGTEIDLLSDEWPGWAISYSGYREGQDPRLKIYPTQEQVLEDLKIIEKNWKIIRTYGADQHAQDVLEVIERENLDLKLMLGIWLDGEPEYTEDNSNQVQRGIELANRFKDIVIAINVGNECQVYWSDHKVPQANLIKYINEVKEKVSVPVTTADTWDYWANLKESAKVIDAVDFIAAHTYPIWGGVDIDRGMEATIENFNTLKDSIPHKKIVITEAGWATYTVGEMHAPRAGDEIKQKEYFFDLMKWSEENKIIVFNFEAFDEPWKGTGTEGHWGLFSEKRKAKLVMQELYPDLMPDGPTSPGYD